ncbi:hypothetical protein DPMN_143061 [Dreissena polymorpha]|uniref:Uncharacterized protein n=1 Tax=Dreissena polymorpha TaxID=45954 RepID=A0A9D4GGI0_DREPO|nr:hypothetical protein DPMN_143061 [Dreissena polymorpha]
MSAPGNVLVFALLMLDLNRCCASLKSIWLCIFPSGAYQVAVLVGLCGFSVLAWVSCWLPANSRSLKLPSLVSPKPNLPTLAFQSSGALRMSFLGTLTMMCSNSS